MNVGFVSDLQYGDENAMADFININAYAHETWYTQLMQGSPNVTIDHYPLNEFNEQNENDWLEIHDKEHKSVASALGLSAPPDFLEVEFRDDKEFTDWLMSHAQEHDRIDQALGL